MIKIKNIYVEVDTLDNIINSFVSLDYYDSLVQLAKESNVTIVVTFEEEVIGKLKYDGKTKSLKQL